VVVEALKADGTLVAETELRQKPFRLVSILNQPVGTTLGDVLNKAHEKEGLGFDLIFDRSKTESPF